MSDYKKLYLILFNAITDALNMIDESKIKTKTILKSAQKKTEELYIENADSDRDSDFTQLKSLSQQKTKIIDFCPKLKK